MNVRMNVDARLEPLCPHAAGYQPAELDLRRSLDSHPAASNVIVSLLHMRKSRLRIVRSTCPGIMQLVEDAERIQRSGRCGVIAHVPLWREQWLRTRQHHFRSAVEQLCTFGGTADIQS